MTSTDTIFETAQSRIYQTLGAPAVFTPLTGAPQDLYVVLREEESFQPGGFQSAVCATETVVRYMRADIDRKLVPGETFTIGSAVYTVRAMREWTSRRGKAVVS